MMMLMDIFQHSDDIIIYTVEFGEQNFILQHFVVTLDEYRLTTPEGYIVSV